MMEKINENPVIFFALLTILIVKIATLVLIIRHYKSSSHKDLCHKNDHLKVEVVAEGSDSDDSFENTSK